MNPIIVLQLKKLLVSLTIVLNLIIGQTASHSHLLGVSTVTNGNNYPTSTYTFSDNDIINAGDINNITTYTGIRSATDTISLQGQIYNASSAVNGLFTSTSTVTVPHGGTATTSYTYGVVLASGTQAFSTIAPGSQGQVLTSNGSTWSSQTLASTTWTKMFYSASTTFTVPTGINTIFLTMVGGGGGGGASGNNAACGGGGGGSVMRFPTSTTPGQVLTVQVGDGGRGGTTQGTVGENASSGMSSTIQNSGIWANGGIGGVGGGSGAACSTPSAGGTSTIALFIGASSTVGVSNQGGNGGGSLFGVGGIGNPGSASASSTAGYGGGGGGGGSQGGATPSGDGKRGFVIIEY